MVLEVSVADRDVVWSLCQAPIVELQYRSFFGILAKPCHHLQMTTLLLRNSLRSQQRWKLDDGHHQVKNHTLLTCLLRARGIQNG